MLLLFRRLKREKINRYPLNLLQFILSLPFYVSQPSVDTRYFEGQQKYDTGEAGSQRTGTLETTSIDFGKNTYPNWKKIDEVYHLISTYYLLKEDVKTTPLHQLAKTAIPVIMKGEEGRTHEVKWYK